MTSEAQSQEALLPPSVGKVLLNISALLARNAYREARERLQKYGEEYAAYALASVERQAALSQREPVSLERCARAIVACKDAYWWPYSEEGDKEKPSIDKLKKDGLFLEAEEYDGFDAVKLAKAVLDAAGVAYD